MQTTTKSPLQEFITNASKVHNNYYSYENAVYINSKTKLEIICPEHGVFTQIPNAHLRGVKCPKCALIQRANKRRTSLQVFIEKANAKHSNFYTYDNVIYKNSHTKVMITCPIHGDFEQTPFGHLAGNKCKQCAYQDNTFTWQGWEQAGLKSNNFTGFKTYIIECWNETERFIKIGKTFTTIALRYSGSVKLPYSWKLLHVYEGSADYISLLESKLHAINIDFKYIPKLQFKGSATECFSSYIPLTEVSL